MGGGPIRTISNLVHILGDEFRFKIVTLDRDLGSNVCYPGIEPNQWRPVGKADVFYISPINITLNYLRYLINSTNYDVLYLNSFFSFDFSIKPLILRHLGLIRKTKIIIAPRGEFSSGALRIRAFKKRSYLLLAKFLGLYNDVTWQASSNYEIEDITRMLQNISMSASPKSIVLAPNLSNIKCDKNETNTDKKKKGVLKAVFLSRISPKKNLDGALSMINGLNGDITFNIYGPIEDRSYWLKCLRIIIGLQSNINVQYKGPISHEKVVPCLSNHDLFFFPTHGENYGHVIIEAFVAGCPVIISDQTPWRNLKAKGVGWDISLAQSEKFKAVLQKCVDMDDNEMKILSRCAREYGEQWAFNEKSIQLNRILFNS